MSFPVQTLANTLDVIDRLSHGTTLTRALDQVGMTYETFRKYVAQSPELQTMYAEADQRGADVLADILLEIDSNPIYGSSNPAMAKVLSDNIKWLLSRRHSNKYGDKVVVENRITADKTILDALNAAKVRATRLIEGEIIRPLLPAPASDDVTDIEVDTLSDTEKADLSSLY